jgi:hypothetical protein
MTNPTSPAFNRSATKTPTIAGPLGSKASPHHAFYTNDNLFYHDCFANQLNASDPNCKNQNISIVLNA